MGASKLLLMQWVFDAPPISELTLMGRLSYLLLCLFLRNLFLRL